MAIQGDPSAVLALSGTSDLDAAVTWLGVANALLSQRLPDSGLSGAILARIEEHLAAHYLELGEGPIKTSERLPDWAATYAAGRDLSDLRSTRNGQIAVQLDTTGSLAEASKPTPSFAVL